MQKTCVLGWFNRNRKAEKTKTKFSNVQVFCIFGSYTIDIEKV